MGGSIKVLLDMVYAEAIEGLRDHYFDEARNRSYIHLEPEIYAKPQSNLSPIKFDLELIQNPDGSLEWVE